MKFWYILAFFVIFLKAFSANSDYLKFLSVSNGALENYPLEDPHEITLSEDQKNEGKSKILFTQDPGSYFYILITPPLHGNTKDDFEYDVNSKNFLVKTKPNAKNHYEAVVNFIKPAQENLPKNINVESHGVDGSFSITLRIAKSITDNGENDKNVKTFYKQTHAKLPPKFELKNDDYGIKDVVEEMDKNSEGEIGKALVGTMNSFEESLSNPNLQEKFNQTYYSTDEVAEQSTKDVNNKLQEFLGPLNEAIDADAIKKDLDMPNKEEFAKNASEALNKVDSGDTSALQNLLSNIDTDKIEEAGKKSSKKQMKDKEKQKKTEKFSKDNTIADPDAMQKNSSKENEKNKEEKKKDAEAKKKQAKKDEVLHDAKFNF